MVGRVTVEGRFMPDVEECVANFKDQRWPDSVTFPNCGSEAVITIGTTSKGAQ